MKKLVHWDVIPAGLMVLLLVQPIPTLGAARAAELDTAERDAVEFQRCRTGLRLLHDAIQHYRKDHQALPNRLSDLPPKYVATPEILLCPTSQRRGKTSHFLAGYTGSDVADTGTTYLYEFRTNTIPETIFGGFPRSMRDWKRLQMTLVGGKVPIVRCLAHSTNLNLAFDGEVYESGLMWELRFSDVVKLDDLSYDRLFAKETAFWVIRVPMRLPDTPPGLVDLSDYYNASLRKGWTIPREMEHAANSLTNLAAGLHTLNGVRFDVRGLVQLRGDDPRLDLYPRAVTKIPVGVRGTALHFLHAAAALESEKPAPGTRIGHYVVRYENGHTETLPIVYGSHVIHWRSDPKEYFRQPLNSRVAWEGTNESVKKRDKSIFLFQTKWVNAMPQVKIESLDFVSAMTPCGPFLVAVTVEP